MKTLFSNSVWGVPYAKVLHQEAKALVLKTQITFQVLDQDTGMDISVSEEAGVPEQRKDEASKCRIS